MSSGQVWKVKHPSLISSNYYVNLMRETNIHCKQLGLLGTVERKLSGHTTNFKFIRPLFPTYSTFSMIHKLKFWPCPVQPIKPSF